MSKTVFSIDMPRPYYWEQLDNFFHKSTAMESPRKNNDCYFYFYSTCTKGDSCTFRHEPSALGCETMCSYWQQGKCLNQHCNFRHMELRKNRKAIPCYWETQPSGCRKPHCPFQHKNPREVATAETVQVAGEPAHDQQKNDRAEWSRRQAMENNQHPGEMANNAIECGRVAAHRINQAVVDAPNYGAPSVDPLVVNFEEESDSESTINTPIKNVTQYGVKTLEEIRLEKVQEASAAIYDHVYDDHDDDEMDLRQRLSAKRTKYTRKPRKNLLESVQNVLKQAKKEADTTKQENLFESIKIKTLEEIRRERALKSIGIPQNLRNRLKRSASIDDNAAVSKKVKISRKRSCANMDELNVEQSNLEISRKFTEGEVRLNLDKIDEIDAQREGLSKLSEMNVDNNNIENNDEDVEMTEDVTQPEGMNVTGNILQDIDELLGE